MIAYIITACICLTVINFINARMISDCGFSWKHFIYKLSENNGRCIYLLIFSVFSYLIGFIFSFSKPIIGYLFILLTLALSATYSFFYIDYLKKKTEGCTVVFIISELILSLLIFIGAVSGGAISCMLFILSLFIIYFSAKIYERATSSLTSQKFIQTDFMPDKYRVCIISSLKQDIASTFCSIAGDEKICKVYDGIPPRVLCSKEGLNGDICIVNNEPEGVSFVSELINLVKPNVLVILGTKDEPDRRILNAVGEDISIFTDNETLLKLNNSRDVASLENKDYGYSSEENMIISLCVEICLMASVDEKTIENNIIKIMG